VWAAPELLGAPTIDGGSARSGGGGGGHRSQIRLPSRPKYMKTAKNGQFCTHFGKYITENAVFLSKVLNKIYSQDVFRGIYEF
jgi:hypothetical protein